MDWRERDRRIVAEVERWGCMSVAQVAALHFPQHVYAEKKARERLRALTRENRLQSFRYSGRNIYTTSKPGKNCAHNLAVVDAYISLIREKKSWEEIDCYKEFVIGEARADLFCIIKNTATKHKSAVIVEVDNGTNPFDKVSLYNDIFEGDGWTRLWWADLNKEGVSRFPRIVVFTTRPGTVRERIEQENRNNLRWEVCPCERLL